MDDGEDALAAHPSATAVFDLAVIQDGGLVQLDAASMDGSGEGDLIGVEELPARSPDDIVRSVAQDGFDRGGGVEQSGVEG